MSNYICAEVEGREEKWAANLQHALVITINLMRE